MDEVCVSAPARRVVVQLREEGAPADAHLKVTGGIRVAPQLHAHAGAKVRKQRCAQALRVSVEASRPAVAHHYGHALRDPCVRDHVRPHVTYSRTGMSNRVAKMSECDERERWRPRS